jgi:uncharacterized caspase-like protein
MTRIHAIRNKQGVVLSANTKWLSPRLLFLLIIVPALVWLWAGVAIAETRVALVIGNAEYRNEPLKNPVHDARLMAETLKRVGFSVTQIQNVDLDEMRAGIAEFVDAVKRAGPGVTALFYYAGKGALVNGESLLMPVDIDAKSASNLEDHAVGVTSIYADLGNAGAGWRILIVDAGRQTMPSSGGTVGNKLAPEPDAPDSAIAYSTSPGSAASDGDGANSPYTSALCEAILKPGLVLDDVFRDARIGTMAKTNQAQVPWDSISYLEPFYFIPPQ